MDNITLPTMIDTCISNMKTSNSLFFVWRGIINGEDWKIITSSRDYNYSNIDIKLKQRIAVE